MNEKTTRRFLTSALVGVSLLFSACLSKPNEATPTLSLEEYRSKLDQALNDPMKRSKLIAKVLGTTDDGERHAYLKFHVFGFAGEGNIVPFFSMNNYVIQDWTQVEEGEFDVQHREVAYYSKFDSLEPISEWENPFTGEVVDLPHFVLGPVPRYYGLDPSDTKASFASDPLNITMIGDRVYVPTLTVIAFPNTLTPDEWGPYSNGPVTYWDSMIVYSAEAADVFDENKSHVDAEIHMQNLVSWAPNLKMGQHPGRTMVRAYGQHISGFDELPDEVRKNLETYTPEIFDENWSDLRMDTIELVENLTTARENGTLDIDQEDYVPFEVDLTRVDTE